MVNYWCEGKVDKLRRKGATNLISAIIENRFPRNSVDIIIMSSLDQWDYLNMKPDSNVPDNIFWYYKSSNKEENKFKFF